jgi:hypothetical protein
MGGAIASGARDWRNLLLQEKGIVWSCAGFATEKSSSNVAEPAEHQVAIAPTLLGLCCFLPAFGPPFLHHFGELSSACGTQPVRTFWTGNSPT